MNRSETGTKLAVALLKAQTEMGNATKDSKNPFFKSTYADLNSIREVAMPALNANGVVVLQPTVVGDNGKNYVETVLLHESGEWLSGITEIKNADGKPQTEGSGISYARRYGLQSFLSIGAVDDDGEAAQGRQVKAEVKVEANKVTSTGSGVSTSTTADKQSNTVSKAGAPNKGIGTPKALIEQKFAFLQSQGLETPESFKEKFLDGKGLTTLTTSQHKEVLTKIDEAHPHLKGEVNGK